MLRSLARPGAVARAFSCRAALLNALVFRMPAMSPTMTEGGIVSWKYKSGDAFSAGDVLLEVETDKATIDVEATDDGILWELLRQDGENGIPVGKPIALLAEPGDDLATLERPALDDAGATQPEEKSAQKTPELKTPELKTPEQKTPERQQKAPAPQQSAPVLKSSGLVGKANAALKMTPAVEVLLHRHGISEAQALENIPASGPKGRLLKGDILAYLGEIDAGAVARVAEYAKAKEHLDLSNIKLAEPLKASEKKADAPAEKSRPSNIVSIEFTAELGEDVSKEKFQFAFERAVASAKQHTHATRFPNYARSPVSSGLYEDDLFGDLLVAPVSKDRFEVQNIAYKFIGGTAPAPAAAKPADAFDELLGLGAPANLAAAAPSGPASMSAVVSFQVKFDAKLNDSKEFVDGFQESLLSQIPSKQLIVRH